jgi:glycosyltransferase 2 family protein
VIGIAVALLAAQRLTRLVQKWLLRMQAGRETFLSRQAGIALTTIETIQQISTRRYAAGLTLLSVLIWVVEAGVMFCAWMSLGDAAVSPFVLLFAFGSATIATLFPSLPGHFGTFEFAGVEAFALAGTDRSTAAAAVLLTHLLLWAPIALFAIGWLVRRMSDGMRPFAAG